MGAKQSKRSVDISGKEAESAGEVAAAGAGGEGRVEQLADADALKPQANGDAHIHDNPEKEKKIDIGTPENEKDAITEKEMKDQEENEKEKETPVANGENEPKENGESTPSPDDGKKNKKEKVKKKWSLRSISFSRKDKPKQEKKQKDEEVKTNGEPEKVPEEAIETTPEVVDKEVAAEIKPDTENKDEKTPETPVTEPLTNGSSTPETPKVESPIGEESTNVSDIRPEPKVEVVEPEQLPVNGLSLEEPKKVEPEVSVIDSNKTEESKVENTESVATTESPVKKEVCVDQTPLIEPTPPPLPANPPPSSVASFAATTMAPEHSDASLANNADITVSTPVETTPDNIGNTNTDSTPTDTKICDESEPTESLAPLTDVTPTEDANLPEPPNELTQASLPIQDDHDVSTETVEKEVCDVQPESVPVENEIETPAEPETEVTEETSPLDSVLTGQEEINDDQTLATPEDLSKEISNSEISKMEQDSGICELKETDVDVSIVSQNGLNHSSDEAIETECLKAKTKETIESAELMLNGDALTNGERSLDEAEDELPSGPEEESLPLPGDLCPEPEIPISPPQEPLPVADKIADLMPEIPTVPELNTETETTTDVVVAN